MNQLVKRTRTSSPRQKNEKTNVANIRRQVLPVLKHHDVKRAALFGSFARGEGTRHSDIDLLVEFKGSKSLFDLAALKLDLENRTGRKVDVLTYRAIHPAIRSRILSEQVSIL